MNTVWVTLRADQRLHADLAEAARAYHISQSELARKAVRKAARLKPGLAAAAKRLGSTHQGGMLRLELCRDQQPQPDTLRAVLRWYLDLPRRQAPEEFKTDLREGVDYEVRYW